MDAVATIIQNLRTWRALPGYSVERRIDALLSPYLAAFLGKRMKADVELVSAEFPLPKRLFEGADGKRQHIAADFLCLRRGASPAWLLVELKTDVASKRTKQDMAYQQCPKAGMNQVLTTLSDVKKGTVHEQEYEAMARHLRKLARGVDKIELCYLEPKLGATGGAGNREANPEELLKTWRFGLREFTDGVEAADGDAVWPLLSKLLRGIARSEKGRRTKDQRAA
jgi:hypothetical protein